MEKKHIALNEAIKEFNRLKIADQFDFQKLYLYSIITHSTAIEGSTVSEIENTLMFDEGIVPGGHNVTEQLMNLDLKKAYDYVIGLIPKKPDITVDFLKYLSALIMKNTGSSYTTALGDFDSSAGDLRLVNVSAGRGGNSYLNFQKVPSRLQAFCQWVNNRRQKEFLDAASVYSFSFEVHYRLVSIHPWVDGNGRISRLLMNMIQMEQGLLPSILKKELKAQYIEALAKSQDMKDSSIFIEFMMNTTLEFIKNSISEYNKSNNAKEKIGLYISLDGLRMAFERFDENESYASCGEWEIKRDGVASSDLWTAYFQDIPIAKCIAEENCESVKRLADIPDKTFTDICDVARSIFPRCRMDSAVQNKINRKSNSMGR